MLLDRPGIYLREIRVALPDEIGIDIIITVRALCKYRKGWFYYQNMVTYMQLSRILQSRFRAELAVYPAHTLAFVDKTGTDRRDALRKKVYSVTLQMQKLY